MARGVLWTRSTRLGPNSRRRRSASALESPFTPLWRLCRASSALRIEFSSHEFGATLAASKTLYAKKLETLRLTSWRKPNDLGSGHPTTISTRHCDDATTAGGSIMRAVCDDRRGIYAYGFILSKHRKARTDIE